MVHGRGCVGWNGIHQRDVVDKRHLRGCDFVDQGNLRRRSWVIGDRLSHQRVGLIFNFLIEPRSWLGFGFLALVGLAAALAGFSARFVFLCRRHA